MEQTITKKRTFLVSIVLTLLLSLVFLFAGCNPTPPPAEQITTEQMKSAFLNFGQKVESLETYTGTTNPTRTPEANENSELGLPYSLYEDFSDLENTIDFYFERAGFLLILDNMTLPIINYIEENPMNFVLNQPLTIQPVQQPITFTFSFDNNTNTLIAFGSSELSNNYGVYGYSYMKFSLKLTENDWISADLQIKTTMTDDDYLYLGYVNFINDTTNDYIKSCFAIQTQTTVSDTSKGSLVEALEFDTHKYLLDSTSTGGVFTNEQDEMIYDTYLAPCKALGNEQ